WHIPTFDIDNRDTGLGHFTGRPEHMGAFKTPTLRNSTTGTRKGLTRAYMHNGYFKTLEQVVHFYNTAAVKDQCAEGTPVEQAMAQDCWPPPENPGFIPSPFLFGDIGLTPDEEAALVAYMKTLDDRLPVSAP